MMEKEGAIETECDERTNSSIQISSTEEDFETTANSLPFFVFVSHVSLPSILKRSLKKQGDKLARRALYERVSEESRRLFAAMKHGTSSPPSTTDRGNIPNAQATQTSGRSSVRTMGSSQTHVHNHNRWVINTMSETPMPNHNGWDTETVSDEETLKDGDEVPSPVAYEADPPSEDDDALPELEPTVTPSRTPALKSNPWTSEEIADFHRMKMDLLRNRRMARSKVSSFREEAEEWLDSIGMPEYTCPMYGGGFIPIPQPKKQPTPTLYSRVPRFVNFTEEEIEAVIAQANVSRQQAIQALRKNKNVIDAIVDLTP